jgi:hypothetical protein
MTYDASMRFWSIYAGSPVPMQKALDACDRAMDAARGLSTLAKSRDPGQFTKAADELASALRDIQKSLDDQDRQPAITPLQCLEIWKNIPAEQLAKLPPLPYVH